jgi:hypothetical protein
MSIQIIWLMVVMHKNTKADRWPGPLRSPNILLPFAGLVAVAIQALHFVLMNHGTFPGERPHGSDHTVTISILS